MNSYSYPLSASQGQAPIHPQSIRDSLQRSSGSPSRFFASYYLIRFVLEGKEQVNLPDQRLIIHANQFALVNPSQEVTISSSPGNPSLGISFRIGVKDLKQVLRSMPIVPNATEGMMDQDRMQLFEQTYPMYGSKLGRLLAQTVHRMEPHAPHKRLVDVLGPNELVQSLVEHQVETHQQINLLTSAKLSTRQELYRRLCQARYYIHENLDAPLDLDTLSQVACLSKFHFIRLFKEAFEQTPRQYLITKRLEAASNLLIHSSKTFHEICHEVGLKDSSSFGRLFKRNFGATPHSYRQLHAVS